jgi:hypothetical protein
MVDTCAGLDIGGVDEHGNRTKVTAVNTYKTLFRISGQGVLLPYGLSESVSTNTSRHLIPPGNPFRNDDDWRRR